MNTKAVSLILTLSALTIHSAMAVEGALGRPISGAGVNPYAGVIPPTPGFLLGVSELYYTGEIGGSGTIPVGANLTLNLDLDVSFTPVTLTYIWDTKNPCWNFASAIALPIVWIEAEADVSVGPLVGTDSPECYRRRRGQLVRAESDLYFGNMVKDGALGKFVHRREPLLPLHPRLLAETRGHGWIVDAAFRHTNPLKS